MPTQAKVRVNKPSDESDINRLVDVVFQSFAGFGLPRDQTEHALELMGHENLRVARIGEQVVAGLGMWPFGQWFGGREVSSVGISVVGVAPEHRGSGVGRALITAVVRELRAKGNALSVLYPSTWRFYRGVGYEPAGSQITYRLNTDTLNVRESAGLVRPADDADWPAIHAVYAEYARRSAGTVVRTVNDWRGLPEWRKPVFAYVVEIRKRIQGYALFTQVRGSQPRYDIRVRDLAALTPEAGRRLWAFFTTHRSLVESLLYRGAPADPLLLLMPQENMKIASRDGWMLRVLDVPKALAARGYPPGLKAEVHFAIRDPLFRSNHGRWLLKVSDGRGNVRKGGRGRLHIDIRGLAPLYTGYLPAESLRIAGLLEGTEPELARASAVFAGPAPWMSDNF